MGRKIGHEVKKETREKLRLKNLGKKIPKNVRLKIRKSLLGRKRPPFSKEWKEKISNSLRGKCGPQSRHWLGGESFKPYSVDWNETLKTSIRERDHYVCRICLERGWHIHHIDYNKFNCNPNNLITLCVSCHAKTNFNRKYWKSYFIKLCQ